MSTPLPFHPRLDPATPTFLVGPTASGKSSLAMTLARQHSAAILCMDSMQIYRGASIGTNQPTQEEQKKILHGGLNLIEINQPYNVAHYLQAAQTFAYHVRKNKQPLLIVGGTGLYFRALTQGLCLAPPGSAQQREEMSKWSLDQLQKRLQTIDPEIYQQMDSHNPRRLIRAIEVKETTSRSLLEWQKESSPPIFPHYQAFFLSPKREDLKENITQRMTQMWEAGWMNEVRTLLKKYGLACLESFQAIGYAEIAQEIAKTSSSQLSPKITKELHTLIIQKTQQYARRQLTWFRRETSLHILTPSPLKNQHPWLLPSP